MEWFYNQLEVEVAGPYTYWMANGFSGGYMGIQQHADSSQRYVIFSVWDQSTKVEILEWGDGVVVGRFGAEGTGANSHMHFPWKEHVPVHFLVSAVREDSDLQGAHANVYAGYVYDPEQGVWRLLARLRVRPCGASLHTKGYLSGMYSFIEVFRVDCPTCCIATRRARYGNAWFRRKGETNFTKFPNVALTTTCGDKCPERGLSYGDPAEVSDSGGFVLAVGENETNRGLDYTPRPTGNSAYPALLLDALPVSDNSPVGAEPKRGRPLRNWGGGEALRRFGKGPDALECPWYVTDCTTDAKESYGSSAEMGQAS